jgi:hypothetical protein
MTSDHIPENIRRILAPAPGSVIAVRVRPSESMSQFPPQFIAEDIEDLLERSSREWGGEQCDNCGCDGYVIERDPTFPSDFPEGWVVRCSGSEYSDGFVKGCDTTYRLGWFPENQVAF